MAFSFRISVVFILFAVHALAVFLTTMALIGEKPRWRWYIAFYAEYCVVMWGILLYMGQFDTEEAFWWCEPLGLLLVTLIFSAILKIKFHVPLANALV